jgi:hypothetical protein
MPDKDEVAAMLAGVHHEMEPGITRIVRLVGVQEADAQEPVKLLEVNPATSPSGVLPIAFAPDPPTVPYASVVVEVTPEEYERIVTGELILPNEWSVGLTLYPAA